MMSAEQWRDIPSHQWYQASTLGRIRSVEHETLSRSGRSRRFPGRVLTAWVDSEGYRHVTLGKTRRAVHRLVAEAHIGPRPDGLQVRHLDGDTSNNTPGNLAYGTNSDNTLDQVRHGRHHEVNRESCPRRHPLEAPNLLPSAETVGKRVCLACNRAHSTARRVRRAGGTVDFAALADAKYQQILAQPGPLPTNRRSIPALAGVTWGGKR